jgi:hypothetical protein
VGTYETKYETRDGKTYRAEDAPPVPGETKEPAAAPKTTGADNSHTPGKPAKEGV